MKRFLYSLSGIAVLAVIVLAAWNLLRPAPETPGAAPTDVVEPSLDPVAQNDTDDQIATPGRDVVSPDTPVGPGPVFPPATAGVAEQASDFYGRGGGGGGAPFAGATVKLEATLPTESVGPVYRVTSGNLTLDDMRAFADKLGLSGEIYLEWYPGTPTDTRELSVNQYAFRLFDGQERLAMYGGSDLYYENLTYLNSFTQQPPLPFEQSRVIAEQFVQARGLLDMPYEVRQGWGHEVQFVAVKEGRHINNYPILSLTITASGEVSSLSYRPLVADELVEDASLINAAQAWAYVQEHLEDGWFQYTIYPSDPNYYAPQPTGQTTHWERQFEAGQSVVLYSWLQVYRPTSGQGPVYLLSERNIALTGDPALLEELANAAGQNVRLEGQLVGEPGKLSLQVTAWAPQTGPYDLYLNGTTRSEAGQMYLELPGGFRFLIANAPADLPSDTPVGVYSWGVRAENGDQCQAVMDWVSIDLTSTPAIEPAVMPAVDPYSGIESITINQVQLAFHYTYPGEMPYPATQAYSQEGSPHLLPTWVFSGLTNKGDRLEIIIPAVAALGLLP